MGTPPKKKKYTCKYIQSWEKEFSWLKKSEKGRDLLTVKMYRREFNTHHGGKNDAKKHERC